MYSFISRLEQFRVSFCFGMIRSVGEKRKEIDCGQKERGYERRGRGRVLRSSRSLSSSLHKKSVCGGGRGCSPESDALVRDLDSGASGRALLESSLTPSVPSSLPRGGQLRVAAAERGGDALVFAVTRGRQEHLRPVDQFYPVEESSSGSPAVGLSSIEPSATKTASR